MSNRDLAGLIKGEVSIALAARTATVNGSGVDLKGFNSAAVVVVTGTITDATHTISLQDSDDNSTFANVASGLIQGSLPAIGAVDDDKVFEIGYVGGKRYLRVVSTVSGSPVTGGVYGAIVIKGNPSNSEDSR